MIHNDVRDCYHTRASVTEQDVPFLKPKQLSGIVSAEEDQHNIQRHAEHPQRVCHHEPAQVSLDSG